MSNAIATVPSIGNSFSCFVTSVFLLNAHWRQTNEAGFPLTDFQALPLLQAWDAQGWVAEPQLYQTLAKCRSTATDKDLRFGENRDWA